MEEYKQALCHIFNCNSAEDIYNYIKDNKEYTCTTNENGLHSHYTGAYYHPAIIHEDDGWTSLYWLFDGDIKDCTHPFCITLCNGDVRHIIYYSSERIVMNQPIETGHYLGRCFRRQYNTYLTYSGYVPILNDTNYKQGVNDPSDSYELPYSYNKILFTSEFYPLWDEMFTFKFKLEFAD